MHCSLQCWEVNVRRREQCCWLIVDEHEHSCVWMNTGEICYSVWRRCSLWSTAQINLEILFSTVMLRTVEEIGRGKPLRSAERPVLLLIWMLLLLPASQGPFFTWLQQPSGKPTHTICADGNGSHSTVYMLAFERERFQGYTINTKIWPSAIHKYIVCMGCTWDSVFSVSFLFSLNLPCKAFQIPLILTFRTLHVILQIKCYTIQIKETLKDTKMFLFKFSSKW